MYFYKIITDLTKFLPNLKIHSFQDFRKGMNIYLTRHKYKNASTEDLWKALEEASNKPVGKVMRPWTKQKGYPVVRVSMTQTGSKVVLNLKQEKYSLDGDKDTSLWMIPISIATASSNGAAVIDMILEKETDQITLDADADSWIKLNPGTVGYYRTQYPKEMLHRFSSAMKDRTLPALDRLGLLHDLFAMVGDGFFSLEN